MIMTKDFLIKLNLHRAEIGGLLMCECWNDVSIKSIKNVVNLSASKNGLHFLKMNDLNSRNTKRYPDEIRLQDWKLWVFPFGPTFPLP